MNTLVRLAVLMAAIAWCGPAAAKPASALSIARKGYAMARALYQTGRTPVAAVYGWAHRLRRLEGRAARAKHLKRVRALAALVKARVASGQAARLDGLRAELEVALAREHKLRW
jgi:hypothetical protein